jgi:hypothetical protein
MLTLREIATRTGLSPRSVERAIRNGWCPPADERVTLPRGGVSERRWREDSVEGFMAKVAEAKKRDVALSEVFASEPRNVV